VGWEEAMTGEVSFFELAGQMSSAGGRSGRFKLCRDDQESRFGLHQPPAASG
jgi:hypothetical protein